MTRIIRIETCANCPHRDHDGAFGQPSCKPMCRATPGSQELPYTVMHGYGSRCIAVPTYVIPDWCPLEMLSAPEAPLVAPFEFKRPDDTEGGSCD